MSGARGKPRRFWTEIELQVLREFFADSHTADLARAFGRTSNQVLAKANELGLRKSRELVAQMARERSNAPDHPSRAHRFPKGHVPANKGVQRPEGWAPGRMAATQFKPGQRPHTWVPVGSYRVVDGTLELKFCDAPGPYTARWRPVHRIVWEAAHGPVPAGHKVAFKPGRKTTDPAGITLDALELLTHAQVLARNSIHTLHPKVRQAVRARATLTRVINHRTKAKP